MYCKYCGKQIDDDSVYCRYCGKKVGENTEVAETKPTTEEELDYEVIDEETESSVFHIRFKDGNCLYFNYIDIDDETVSVVAPYCDEYNFVFGWDNYSTPKGHLNIPNFVRNKKKYMVTAIESWAFWGCSNMQSIVIPDSVTEIGNDAFKGCCSLQSIVIPDSVTVIGICAFGGCSGLQSIVIPDSVTEVGFGAFNGCSSLQSIVIPDSMTEIAVFSGCSNLQSIVIPNSVTEIRNEAFLGCRSLQSIVIHNSVKSIGYGAFRDCSSLQSIVIPDSVTTIGNSAFENCSSLQSIVIPDSVTKIYSGAFEGCSNLHHIKIKNPRLLEGTGVDLDKVKIMPTEEELDYEVINERTENSDFHIRFKDGNCLYFSYIDDEKVRVVAPFGSRLDGGNWYGHIPLNGNLNIPRVVRNRKDYSVTEIERSAFRGCISLLSIVISVSTTEIGSHAFYDCSNLQNIVIPDSVTKIGSAAFYGCSSLLSIVIPDSVIEIGDDAFEDCTSLQSIIVGKNNPSYDSRNDCNAIIETSSNKLVTGCMNTIIPDSVAEIRECAFHGCSSLQSIVIPNSVTEIKYYAFYGCSSLKSIVIPNSVTKIGEFAFSGCSSLQNIDIPNSVTEIEDYSFDGCSSLQSIVIPNSATMIGDFAFYGCSSLKSIVIPDSVIKIGDDAFKNCYSLQSITIPDSVTAIGDDAFEGCSSLKSIVIPDSLNKIGLWALCNCNSLESIYVSKEKLNFFMEELIGYGYVDKIKVWEGENAKTDLKNTVRKTSNVSPYYLFFDTETTGIPMNYNAPTSDSSNWPRLVQLSWIVTDKDCRVLHQHDHIIYPNGFSIPNDAASIHGITTKIAQAKGVPLQKAIEEFLADFNKVEIIVGHNIAFDKKIVGAELIRLGKKDVMQTKTSRCTMESSTDFCKIYARNGGYKWPKLQELHKKLFDCEFEDAHNSMSDVTATLDCFRELKKRGIM